MRFQHRHKEENHHQRYDISVVSNHPHCYRQGGRKDLTFRVLMDGGRSHNGCHPVMGVNITPGREITYHQLLICEEDYKWTA